MPKKAMENLTESMFYVLMALMRGPMCGTEVVHFVQDKTADRIKIGPATLYTVLAKFEAEGYIAETQVDGRKRTYCITDKGRGAYRAELRRLETMADDARTEEMYYGKA